MVMVVVVCLLVCLLVCLFVCCGWLIVRCWACQNGMSTTKSARHGGEDDMSGRRSWIGRWNTFRQPPWCSTDDGTTNRTDLPSFPHLMRDHMATNKVVQHVPPFDKHTHPIFCFCRLFDATRFVCIFGPLCVVCIGLCTTAALH